MAEKMPQTFANHTKLVPLFHYVALPILSIKIVDHARGARCSATRPSR